MHRPKESLSHSERWQALILGHFDAGSSRMHRLERCSVFRLADQPGVSEILGIWRSEQGKKNEASYLCSLVEAMIRGMHVIPL